MAERGLNRQALENIREGFRSLQEKLERNAKRESLPQLVRELRQIPADDRRKKDQLAKYFQTPEGRLHSRQDRFTAYSELLGIRANRHRG